MSSSPGATRHFLLQIVFVSGFSGAAFAEEMQHDHAPVAVGHSQMDHSKMDHAMRGHSASASKPAELTEGIPGIEGRVFTVGKISAGGIYDFIRTDRAKFGIGGLASRYVLPGDLKTEYGRDLTGFMVFGRLKRL